MELRRETCVFERDLLVRSVGKRRARDHVWSCRPLKTHQSLIALTVEAKVVTVTQEDPTDLPGASWPSGSLCPRHTGLAAVLQGLCAPVASEGRLLPQVSTLSLASSDVIFLGRSSLATLYPRPRFTLLLTHYHQPVLNTFCLCYCLSPLTHEKFRRTVFVFWSTATLLGPKQHLAYSKYSINTCGMTERKRYEGQCKQRLLEFIWKARGSHGLVN